MVDSDTQSIKDLAVRFEVVLGSTSEQEVHSFLENNPQIFGFLLGGMRSRKYRLEGGIVKSKFRLADSYIPDFISIDSHPIPNDIRPLVTFIEIERPNILLFTKSGDPASGLTHAIRQVQNWKHWVTNHRMYFQQVILNILTEEFDRIEDNWLIDRSLRGIAEWGFSDRYLVIAGRRHTMTIRDRILLAQMNDDLHRIKIMTYDVLLDGLLSAIAGTSENTLPNLGRRS